MSPNASLHITETPHSDQMKTVDIKSIMNTFSIVIYTLTVVLGITGNAIVVWVAGFKLKAKVTNVWLVNLAVADLIFCFTRVFSVIQMLVFGYWPFGVFLCKFTGFFKYANMFCSVFLLAVISLDRMLCVWRPVLTKQHRTMRNARLVAVCVWIAAIIFSTPYFIHRKVTFEKNLTKCSVDSKQKDDINSQLALYSIRFVCGFLLPFMVILICYILAGIRIRRMHLPGKSNPLRVLASLVIAFFLCWAPYHFLQLVKLVDSKNPAFKIWQPVTSGIGYFNSCVNPVLYFCMGVDIRKRFKQSLFGVCQRALADDMDTQTTQSNEISLENRLQTQSGCEASQTSVTNF